MNPRMYKATVLLVVAAVLVIAIAWRLQHRASAVTSPPTEVAEATAPPAPSGPDGSAETPAATAASQPAEGAGPKPTPSASSDRPTPQFPAVLDLGMGKCIPCKQMKPILEELKREYAGRCRVEIIDITDRRNLADKYRINLIPTQIFLDKDRKEVYRHEGFMPKADIVAKLRGMGVE
jgi:thioredoxin